MRRSLMLVAFALSVLACTSGEQRRSHAAPLEPERERPAPEDPAPPVETLPPSRTVSFVTEDGVHIVGTLQPAAHADAPAVVLVHQLGSDRSEWAPLLERLQAQPSLTTLAIDLRGHGASTEGPSGALEWHAFDTDAWTATRLDVRAAVAFLRSADSGVSPSRFGAIGSSIGSSAVVAAAAEEPALSAIVALSPGRAYHGFDAITPAIGLGDRAILAIVSREETDGVDTAQAFGRIGHNPAVVVDGSAHGVALFTLDPTTLDRVDAFLREHLSAETTAVEAPIEDVPPSGTALPD
jgi:pimeloyl-ACP methyl ester carboxylesterase